STVVVGVASSSDPKQLGRIGIKKMAYYLITTGIAISIGLAVAFMISAGTEVSSGTGEREIPEAAVQDQEGPVQTILNIIPENPFTALAEGNVLQIIFFALFIGLGITLVGEKANPVLTIFEAFSEIMYKITALI